MAAVDDVQNDGFSFIWTIQNLSHCNAKKGEAIISPEFILKGPAVGLYDTRWCLRFYPKGYDSNSITLELFSGTLLDTRELNFDFVIFTCTGIFEQKTDQKKNFDCHNRQFVFKFTLRLQDLYKKGQLKNDSLTVGCRIWKLNNLPVASGQCHFRTIILVEKNTCSWTLANFIKNKPLTLRSKIPSELSSFSMELSSTEGSFAEQKIQVEIKPEEKINTRLFSTCEVSLLNIDGKKVYSVRKEHWFEKSENIQNWKLFLILMSKLLGRRELYLPSGTLFLRCEFAVSSGATQIEMESNEYGIANLSKLANCKQEKESEVPKSLNDNLKCFYTEGKLSDLTIQTANKEFRAHKTILCARSEVFCAMFEHDTKENLSGVINIEDIDDDTVSKMLLFLYTDSVGEDLEFETASSLYFAADKYRIVALKKKCVDFLKGNFTLSNVCDALVLADLHKDQELKPAVQKFIFEHSGEVMDSEEWTRLMQNNLQLASETMRLLIRNSKV